MSPKSLFRKPPWLSRQVLAGVACVCFSGSVRAHNLDTFLDYIGYSQDQGFRPGQIFGGAIHSLGRSLTVAALFGCGSTALGSLRLNPPHTLRRLPLFSLSFLKGFERDRGIRSQSSAGPPAASLPGARFHSAVGPGIFPPCEF